MRKILLCLLTLTMLVGCQQIQETVDSSDDVVEIENTSEDYYKMIYMGSSELREDYYSKFSRTDDLVTIGRGLELLSADYFSMSSHYLSEGQYLTLDDRKEMTTYYNSDEHPYSLEPTKKQKIQGISKLDMIEDIHEQDYYTKSASGYTLAGVSFAIIVDPKTAEDQESVSITDKNIKSYCQDCVNKLYSNIQEMSSLAEIKSVPILVAIYRRTDSSKSSIDGNYILKAYCDGKAGTLKEVNYKNVIFTSEEARELDPTTYEEFETIKNNLKNASLEASSLVGEAKYIDDNIQSMTIEAHLNIKTYTEILYLTSVIENNVESKFSTDFTVNVLVYSQDDLQAIITRSKSGRMNTSFLK